MALVKLRDFNPGTDGVFIAPVPLLEQLGATRALVTSDDGVCQGYSHTDGRLWAGPLITPNASKISADSAASTAAADLATKDNAARTVISNQVAATRPKMPPPVGNGTATAQERWLMALSWLIFRQE